MGAFKPLDLRQAKKPILPLKHLRTQKRDDFVDSLCSGGQQEMLSGFGICLRRYCRLGCDTDYPLRKILLGDVGRWWS